MPVLRLIPKGQLSITPDWQVQPQNGESLEPHQSGRISEPRKSDGLHPRSTAVGLGGGASVSRCLASG